MPPRRTNITDLPVNVLSRAIQTLNMENIRNLALAGRATRSVMDAARIAWKDTLNAAGAVGVRSPTMEVVLQRNTSLVRAAIDHLAAAVPVGTRRPMERYRAVEREMNRGYL